MVDSQQILNLSFPCLLSTQFLVVKINFIFVLILTSITYNQIEPFRELLNSTVKLTLCWGNWDGKDDNEEEHGGHYLGKEKMYEGFSLYPSHWPTSKCTPYC